MCGITGFVGDYDRKILRNMNRTMVHRGPDDEGYYLQEGVGLAMRRLSIIDPEGGHQPIPNEDKTIWTVFNGEIYNFQGIRKDLIKKGYRFRTNHSDTEVIVHAFQEYGPLFVERLNGMFAIAIWDQKRRQLYLYRDRLGEKPLYYWHSGREFFFGSEIKAILKVPRFKKSLNPAALFYYLGLKSAPRDFCFFEGIQQLGPGEYLVFEKGRVVKRTYWSIDASCELKIDEQEAASEIRRLLKSSVRYRLISDVPLGAYLSGGVDSSAVVGLMSRIRKTPIETFALTYADRLHGKDQDQILAHQMSKRFGTLHREHRMKSSEFVNDLDDVLTAFDEPFGGTISTYFLSKLIRKHVKVAVSGDGADELFGSYRAHRLAYPIQNLNGLMKRGYNPYHLSGAQKRKLVPFENQVDYLLGIRASKPYQWHAKLVVFSDEERRKILTSKIRSRIEGCSTLEYYKRAYSRTRSEDVLNQVLQVECQNLLPDQILSFVDRLSMAHSVEVRPPYLDHRLVEFAFKLPGRFKIKDGVTKYILKSAVRGILPKHVIHRPKEGFILPYHYWLETYLKDRIKRILAPKNLKRHGCFDSRAVGKLVENYHRMGLEGANKVLLLMSFQLWWNKYMDT